MDILSETNDLATVQKRQKKFRSAVWEYFFIDAEGDGSRRARCKTCNRSFAYSNGSKASGTSHLKRHIISGTCKALLGSQTNQSTPNSALSETSDMTQDVPTLKVPNPQTTALLTYARIRKFNPSEMESAPPRLAIDMASNDQVVRDLRVNASMALAEKYQVKEEYASLVKRIFEKHGDIFENSPLRSPMTCSMFMEMICVLIKKLQESSFQNINQEDIKSMLLDMKDMETNGIRVDWLREKLTEINEGKELFNESKSITTSKMEINTLVEKAKVKMISDQLMLNGKQWEMDMMAHRMKDLGNEMAALRENFIASEEKFVDLKDKSEEVEARAMYVDTKVNSFFHKSLVDGLL